MRLLPLPQSQYDFGMFVRLGKLITYLNVVTELSCNLETLRFKQKIKFRNQASNLLQI